jgi:hypothetical protein
VFTAPFDRVPERKSGEDEEGEGSKAKDADKVAADVAAAVEASTVVTQDPSRTWSYACLKTHPFFGPIAGEGTGGAPMSARVAADGADGADGAEADAEATSLATPIDFETVHLRPPLGTTPREQWWRGVRDALLDCNQNPSEELQADLAKLRPRERRELVHVLHKQLQLIPPFGHDLYSLLCGESKLCPRVATNVHVCPRFPH